MNKVYLRLYKYIKDNITNNKVIKVEAEFKIEIKV